MHINKQGQPLFFVSQSLTYMLNCDCPDLIQLLFSLTYGFIQYSCDSTGLPINGPINRIGGESPDLADLSLGSQYGWIGVISSRTYFLNRSYPIQHISIHQPRMNRGHPDSWIRIWNKIHYSPGKPFSPSWKCWYVVTFSTIHYWVLVWNAGSASVRSYRLLLHTDFHTYDESRSVL